MITWTLTLDQLLQTIAQSQDSDGHWIQYPNSISLTGFQELPTLSETLTQARTLQGLESTVRQIQDLSTKLYDAIRPPATLRRVPVYSASHGALNPHRVLRGSTRPWRTTSPTVRPAHGRRVTLVLPASLPSAIPHEQAQWWHASTLALADTLHYAGYHVDLAAASVLSSLFERTREASVCLVVHLRQAGDPWALHNVAVAAQATFNRKLLFRFWETQTSFHGPIKPGYGTVELDQSKVSAACLEADPMLRQCVLGASYWSNIDNQSSAIAWIQAQLATITAQAAS